MENHPLLFPEIVHAGKPNESTFHAIHKMIYAH